MPSNINPNSRAGTELTGVPIQCAPCSYGVNVVSIQTCAQECINYQGTKAKSIGILYCWEDSRHAINIVAISIAAVISSFFVWWSNRTEVEFFLLLHICLCTPGTVFLCTLGILIFAGNQCFGRPYKKRYRACVHGYFMIAAFLLVLTGILAHLLSPGGPKVTIHGLVGVAGVITMIVTIIFGMSATFTKCCSCLQQDFSRCFHIFFGLVAYGACMGSLCIALLGDWFKANSSDEMLFAFLGMIGIVGGYTIICALFSMMYYMMLI